MKFFAKRKLEIAVRSVAWAFGACVLALAAYYLAPPLKTAYEVHAQVRVTPFTLQREFYAFDEQHPQGWLGLKETVARSTDGRRPELIKVLVQTDPRGEESGRLSRRTAIRR